MKKKVPPKKRRFKIIRITLLVLAVALIAAAGSLYLYCAHQADYIEKRFSGRRWSLPSKVYSGSLMIYPGQRIGEQALIERLHRSGYYPVDFKPKKKGQMRSSAATVEVYLRDLTLPSRSREGFPLTITFAGDTIDRVFRPDDNGDPGIVELEPEELTVFYGPEREQRKLISVKQTPPYVIAAVLAAEDTRFYDHFGVDPRGILRALWTNALAGEVKQGGSTITQQVVKNYFLTPERTFKRKFNEMLLALTMEAMYDKDDILEIYLNEIYMGQKGSVSINGVGEAAQFYFGKSVQDLSMGEAAAIAGIIRAPNIYSPYKDLERCRKRRDLILGIMRKHNWISAEEYAVAESEPLRVAGYNKSIRTAPFFTDYVQKQLAELYPEEALTTLGLSIYTTLDPEVQIAAEEALEKGLSRLEATRPALKRENPDERLQGAVLVMEPKTGHILAMVGGRDYSSSQFNRVTQALRQPGSAFKPFVFLAALDEFTPASLVSNERKTYMLNGQEWTPENFDGQAGGSERLRTALARSINLASVDLAMKVGLARVISLATSMGISTPLMPYPSLALGAFEVIPLELARAYCSFAADGALPYPLSITGVMDDQGAVLERRHVTIQQVMDPAHAYIMNSLLHSVTTEGTARSLKAQGIKFPVAGKTGTTNGFRDAWFIGYTPDVLALVWVGFDNGDSVQATGGSAALPVWVELMKAIPWRLEGEWFTQPPGVVTRVICADTGELATRGCATPIEEVFLESNAPEPAETQVAEPSGHDDAERSARQGSGSESAGDMIRKLTEKLKRALKPGETKGERYDEGG